MLVCRLRCISAHLGTHCYFFVEVQSTKSFGNMIRKREPFEYPRGMSRLSTWPFYLNLGHTGFLRYPTQWKVSKEFFSTPMNGIRSFFPPAISTRDQNLYLLLIILFLIEIQESPSCVYDQDPSMLPIFFLSSHKDILSIAYRKSGREGREKRET